MAEPPLCEVIKVKIKIIWICGGWPARGVCNERIVRFVEGPHISLHHALPFNVRGPKESSVRVASADLGQGPCVHRVINCYD